MEYVTFGWLKEFVNDKAKIINTVEDKTVITYNDILTSKYVSKFVDNKNLRSCKAGLEIIADNYLANNPIKKSELCLKYVEVDGLYGELSSTNIKAIASEVSVRASLKLNLRCKTNGVETTIGEDFINVKPLLTKDNNADWCVVDNANKKIYLTANISDHSRKANVTLSLFFKGKMITSNLEVKQSGDNDVNKIIQTENNCSLEIVLSNPMLPYYGDKCIIKVLYKYNKTYSRKNALGEVVETRESKEVVDEVTSLSEISLSNSVGFKRLGNVISASEQVMGEKQRSVIITAKYNNLTSTVVLSQEATPEIVKETVLLYSDRTDTKAIEVEANETKLFVPIIAAIKYMYGDVVKDTETPNNIVVTNNSKFINAEFDYDLMGLNVVVEHNTLETKRESILTIACNDKCISLKVVQDNDSLVSEENTILVDGNLTCDVESISSLMLNIKPKCKKTYASGVIEEHDSFTNDSYYVAVTGYSENSDVVNVGRVVKNDSIYVYKHKDCGGSSISDINVSLTFFITDGVNEFGHTQVMTVVKGNKVNTTKRLFKFDGTNQTTIDIALTDNNPTETIEVTSLERQYNAGILTNTNRLPITLLNGSEKPLFNTTVTKENAIVVSLSNASKRGETNNYVIKQTNSNKLLWLNVKYE